MLSDANGLLVWSTSTVAPQHVIFNAASLCLTCLSEQFENGLLSSLSVKIKFGTRGKSSGW